MDYPHGKYPFSREKRIASYYPKSKNLLPENHKPPVKRVVCRRAISPYHYDQRLKALAFTLFKPLCPSYSATP